MAYTGINTNFRPRFGKFNYYLNLSYRCEHLKYQLVEIAIPFLNISEIFKTSLLTIMFGKKNILNLCLRVGYS